MVLIRCFRDPSAAHVARATVTAAGIDCVLVDEHLVSLYWTWSQALGGVKLFAREEDAEDAELALDASISPPDAGQPEAGGGGCEPDAAAPAEESCPSCASVEIRPSTAWRRLQALSLFAATVPLVCVALVFPNTECGSCRATWRDRRLRTLARCALLACLGLAAFALLVALSLKPAAPS